jgi:hypothetical protein
MSGDAPLSTGIPHKTSVQAAAFQQPPNCPLALCATIERGQKELERLNRSEAQLQKALAREQVLLDQKDELIRHNCDHDNLLRSFAAIFGSENNPLGCARYPLGQVASALVRLSQKRHDLHRTITHIRRESVQ